MPRKAKKGSSRYYFTDLTEKVAKSVDKIKKAVDTEVKEKFNTKTTEAKDIFNELFGEAKK